MKMSEEIKSLKHQLEAADNHVLLLGERLLITTNQLANKNRILSRWKAHIRKLEELLADYLAHTGYTEEKQTHEISNSSKQETIR